MTLLGAINLRHRIRRIGFKLVQVPNSGDFQSIAIVGTEPLKPPKSGRLLNGIAGRLPIHVKSSIVHRDA
jgi:hypothetical protein